jgi:putative selenate reductase
MQFLGDIEKWTIDFQIINFTRPEGGDNTGSISPTDNAVKLFMWKSIKGGLMSDKLNCLSLEKLLNWIKREEQTGKIFGIPKSLFLFPSDSDVFRMHRYGRLLESPIGVAAGPHTQLSQNIISAWLTGARYIELKTVQILDELDLTKPCINMDDEGYNCEWSQELKLEQSFNEYLNAMIAISILKKRLGMNTAEPGFIFNMSVGYNLEGILSPTVQAFLNSMTDSKSKIMEKMEIAKKIFPEAADLVLPEAAADNITLSTMHGCPPEEIEKIGAYFIEERKLNTTIKLNPTLLGPDELRDILNNRLGFDIIVPDAAFDHDPKFEAGVELIKSLLEKAKKAGVEFNIKLTNTLEVQNSQSKLPENEQMLYMSGRPLHVITVNLANKLQKEFDGNLDLSFSAGTDCFNVAQLLSCGLKPVTVCSDILKPGGYGRLAQYLTNIKQAFEEKGASSISDFIIKTAGNTDDESKAGLNNLKSYADEVKNDKRYHKQSFPWSTVKTDRSLPPFDCVSAPCKSTCPAGQDVPAYMHYTANGQFKEALAVILQTNPFPNVQGMVCNHPCTEKCTRINYDDPLQIREIKRFIASSNKDQKNQENIQLSPKSDNGLSVAVIGGGPSGFSAAYFLKMNGFSVELFEAKEFGGGMAADAIPTFRLDDLSIQKDIDRITALGVKVHYGSFIGEKEFAELKDKYDYVYIGVGACKAYPLGITGDDAEGVFDQLGFLSDVRRGKKPDLRNNIVVIGGGNSAMDAARTAKRVAGKGGKVSILYRRTIKEMPADKEEIDAALEEGIEIQEMVAPESVVSENGKVSGIKCYKMELGEADESGRPRPIIIEGSEFIISTDSVISAIGQKVLIPFVNQKGGEKDLKVDPVSCKTGIDKVYAGGDAIRGASTLIKAIADGRKAAKHILADAGLEGYEENNKYEKNIAELESKLAQKHPGLKPVEIELSRRNGFDLVIETMTKEMAMEEAKRCLSCDSICSICATVCPNRANISYPVKPFKAPKFKVEQEKGKIKVEADGSFIVSQTHQIINIADFCNECGNCASFCPTSGAPYMDKPKFYLSSEEFEKEDNGYMLEKDTIYKRIQGITTKLTKTEDAFVYESAQLTAYIDPTSFNIIKIEFRTKEDQKQDLAEAAELVFLYKSLCSVL